MYVLCLYAQKDSTQTAFSIDPHIILLGAARHIKLFPPKRQLAMIRVYCQDQLRVVMFED